MESNTIYNGIKFLNNSSYILENVDTYVSGWIAVNLFILPVSLFGMVGNGITIWVLGCHMKRNPFITYILNLSIADFNVLVTLGILGICFILNAFHYIDCPVGLCVLLSSLFYLSFSTSQCLLAIISIDRCICLFSPLWHKYHRPIHLSTILCVITWIFNFLISAMEQILPLLIAYNDAEYFMFLLYTLFSVPAMIVSTIAMLIKVCFMLPHHKRGKLLKAILLALLFFLLFSFPLNVIQFIWNDSSALYLHYYAFIGASLNSAVNPVIYFLVGRNQVLSRARIKKIFEKVFQEEEYCREEVESPVETYL